MPKFNAKSMKPPPTFEENKAFIEASKPYKEALEIFNTVEKRAMCGSESDAQDTYQKWGDALHALDQVFYEELEVLEAQQAPEAAMPALKPKPHAKAKLPAKSKSSSKAGKVLNHLRKAVKRQAFDETIREALDPTAMMFY